MNNVDNIINNLLLCNLSYYEPEKIKNILRYNHLYKSVIPIVKNYYKIYNNKSDITVYIFKDNNTIYIIFRGTFSSKNVLMKSKFKKILNPYVNVHEGFYNQYFSVYDDIFNCISDDITVINILGHSLGGGVATIASVLIANYYLNINSKNKVNCYVFGCPRVGDIKFRNLFINIINNHYNYCFYNDIIGMMPTNYNYKHSCNLFKIRKNGVIVLCKNDIWYKRLYVFLSNKNCYNIFKNYNLESYLYFFYIFTPLKI